MTFLRSLAPWLVFGLLGVLVADRWAALAAAAVAVLLTGLALRSGRRPDQLVIELSTLTFFTGLAVVANLDPSLAVGRWAGSFSQLWLAAVVATTLLRRRPFTLAIARTQAPPEVWDRPEFYAFNVRITRAWLISFAVAGLTLLALAIADRSAVWFTVPIMVLAIVVPVRYTALLQRRRTRGAAA